MYWPNGVPRVYAVNGPDIDYETSDLNEEAAQNASLEKRTLIDAEDDGEDANGHSGDNHAPESESKPESSSHTDSRKWENEAVIGLCVSRSGHMFATMTETSIAVWQTRVCVL